MADFERDCVFNSSPGRMFTSPETEQVLSCALGLHHPVDVAALKAELSATVVTCHPRFTSLLVDDPRPSSHTQYWRKTQVNIDDHVVVVPVNGAADDGASVNDYLAELAVSTPLSKDKPLWEVHVLMGLNCVVFRMHHAVGDGNSLMSMLVACFGGEKAAGVGEKRRRWRKGGLWGMMKSVWYTAVYQAVMTGRTMGVRDDKTVVSGGEGVELWPRTMSTAKFKIDDMKEVKKAIPNATLNDVLLGVVSCGLEKYLSQHSPNAISRGIKMTSIIPANMRKHSGFQEMTRDNGFGPSWGNKTGSFLVPMKFQKSTHPLQHVKRMKAIMDRKKQSFEAQLSYIFTKFILAHFGPSGITQSQKKLSGATTLCMSNIVGPKEDIVIAGNCVSYIRLGVSSVYMQAITLILVSYKGNAEMQVSVVKDIIQDGDFLAKCFEEALLEMVHACCSIPILG